MFMAEEEATALSVWTVACLCGSLRLENVSLCYSLEFGSSILMSIKGTFLLHCFVSPLP